MASAKLLVVLLALVALSQAENMTIGYRVPRDSLLQRNVIDIPSKWLQVVELKQTFQADYHKSFSEIKIIDADKKGKGAKVEVLSGGFARNFIVLKFESTRGGNISYTVEIYGTN